MERPVKYNFKRLYWIIPLVGIILSGLFLIQRGFIINRTTFFYIGHGIIMTLGLWLGCLNIVKYLWKKYPWEHHPVKHIVLEVLLIFGYTLAFSFLLYFIELQFYPSIEVENIYFSAVFTVLITFFITALHEAAYFYQQWKYNFSKSIRLERDNMEARYETLKSQINPHFLFNSLNSLTNLVDDNPKAVDYIQDLSEILRYGLKSRDRELILLREEAIILEKYLNLQKMRFKDNLLIINEIGENSYHFAVPPLVLQMLVENCIKHNIISKEKPLKIKIFTEQEYVVIENNLQKKLHNQSTGQGIRNILERYRYFTTREVKIRETSDKYEIRIPLLKVEI